VIDRRNGEVQSARLSDRADSAFEHDPESGNRFCEKIARHQKRIN